MYNGIRNSFRLFRKHYASDNNVCWILVREHSPASVQKTKPIIRTYRNVVPDEGWLNSTISDVAVPSTLLILRCPSILYKQSSYGWEKDKKGINSWSYATSIGCPDKLVMRCTRSRFFCVTCSASVCVSYNRDYQYRCHKPYKRYYSLFLPNGSTLNHRS